MKLGQLCKCQQQQIYRNKSRSRVRTELHKPCPGIVIHSRGPGIGVGSVGVNGKTSQAKNEQDKGREKA